MCDIIRALDVRPFLEIFFSVIYELGHYFHSIKKGALKSLRWFFVLG